MELNSFHVENFVADAHNRAVVQFARDFKASGQSFALDNQRMIPPDFDALRKTVVNAFAVVLEPRRLAVNDFFSANDFSAENFADSLMSQANAQNRQRAA